MNNFEQTLMVEHHHLDELQHVNNVQYLQWVQDISGAHWQHLIANREEAFGLWWFAPTILSINTKPN